VISSEVAAAVGELKAKPGRELQVHGSRTLIRWPLDNNLVDEMTLVGCVNAFMQLGGTHEAFHQGGRVGARGLAEPR
jgi:hypothetical protein